MVHHVMNEEKRNRSGMGFMNEEKWKGLRLGMMSGEKRDRSPRDE